MKYLELNDETLELTPLSSADIGESWDLIKRRFDQVAAAKDCESFTGGLLVVVDRDLDKIELVGAKKI